MEMTPRLWFTMAASKCEACGQVVPVDWITAEDPRIAAHAFVTKPNSRAMCPGSGHAATQRVLMTFPVATRDESDF